MRKKKENIPRKFKSGNSAKHCTARNKDVFPSLNGGYVMIFIKRPPTGGTGNTVPKQQHTRSYKLHPGEFLTGLGCKQQKNL